MKHEELDSLLHQPVRTRIIVHLARHKECDFNTLKSTLGLTDGHMTTHMRQFIAADCVEVEKAFVQNKPKTTYRLTRRGRQRFLAYVAALKAVLEDFWPGLTGHPS